ncbi:MAG: hypothetical protein HZA91_03675 [Verrucomicrobia bacterium]|nr:hypothetical protein [Verrucomicrobiota bacterium]
MNKHLPLICLCLLAALPQALRAEEKAQFQFDDRKWNPGFQGYRGSAAVTEYILEGESGNNWTELLTAQFLVGGQKRVLPEEFAKGMEARLRNIATGKVTWTVISSSPTEVMYEWSLVKDHMRPDEQSIARVIKSGAGLHLVHYATRKVPMSDAARQKWIGLLNAAKIVK